MLRCRPLPRRLRWLDGPVCSSSAAPYISATVDALLSSPAVHCALHAPNCPTHIGPLEMQGSTPKRSFRCCIFSSSLSCSCSALCATLFCCLSLPPRLRVPLLLSTPFSSCPCCCQLPADVCLCLHACMDFSARNAIVQTPTMLLHAAPALCNLLCKDKWGEQSTDLCAWVCDYDGRAWCPAQLHERP